MKTRKQGNAVILSIPAQFNIPEGVEYMAMKESDGSLIFTPKGDNIFKSNDKKYDDLRQDKNYVEGKSVGREEI
ncbi:type II toxin-antitoxin system PemI/MazE family antitoxin [Companilactobacillus jidongensis]|uniref:type II toxin-antitoxin system PemI/MazE family antitoxin n=1 Tax=Companilactobacillus jidongensis TaxID=2486006 RepID=UPI000F7A7115|nr:AbrB family transcriptional regulator [Companilactobacillus jidongensis]